MTLDLDELERKAKADLWIGPIEVLALIERVRELERERPKTFAEMTDEERENYRAAGDR